MSLTSAKANIAMRQRLLSFLLAKPFFSRLLWRLMRLAGSSSALTDYEPPASWEERIRRGCSASLATAAAPPPLAS